jgi:outer membrane protein OmpA-like peptidoglycan-associated protein
VIGAGLPFFGAWLLNTSSLDTRLAEAAKAGLLASGADWADIQFDGRDAILTGEGPSPEAVAAATEAVAATYGVRRVDATGLKVAPPLAAPAVSSFATNNPQAAVTGTWPEGTATSLSVTLGDKTFNLGTDENLSSDGKGNWSLVVRDGLADGTYDITAEISDKLKRTVKSEAPGKLVLDRVPPAPPAIGSFIGKENPRSISGSWDAGDATSLEVTFAEKTYVLGTDKDLTSEESRWTLSLPSGIADGVYPVTVESADSAGNISKAEALDAVIIDSRAPAPPTVNTSISTEPIRQLSGTWAEGDAARLKVTVGGNTYEKGTYLGLRSQGKGKWVLDLAEPLAEGTYAVTAENADIAGNSASVTVPKAVIVDSRPSAPPAVDPVRSRDPVTAITGTWDDTDATSLKVTAGGNTYEKGVYSGLATTGGGKWRLNLAAPLAEGKYDVTVETVDAAGNSSMSAAASAVIVDPSPPMPPAIDAVVSRQPVRTISGTYDPKDTAELKITVGDRAYEKGTYLGLAAAGGRWTLTPATALGEGTYDVVATASDQVGNTATTSAAGAVVVDMTPPAPPAVDRVTSQAPVSTVTGTWDNAGAKTIKVVVGGSTYELRTYTGLTASGSKWSLALAGPLGNGTHGVAVETADAAGNVSSVSDQAAIVVTIALAAPAVEVYAGNNPSPVIAGTADKNTKSLAVALGGKVYVLGKDPQLKLDSTGHWSLTPAEPLKDATYDVVAVATDAGGGRHSDETVGEVTIDTTPPAPPMVDIIADNNPEPVVSGSMAKDAKSLAVALNGKVYVLGKDTALMSPGEGLWKLIPEAPLPEGNFDVVAVTADQYGNKSSDQTVAEVTVDLTGPPAPTVNKVAGNNPRPVITGTIGKDTKSLAVAVGGKVFVLGKDDALITDGAGNWTLTPPEPLKDGIYDVVAVAGDAYDNRTSDETVGEVTVDTTPPVPPAVDVIADNNPIPTVTGSMARDAKSLAVALNGKVYVLGKDPGLTIVGEGLWSLKPEKPLPEGNFDVVAVTADQFGNKSSDETLAEVTVDLTGPKTPAVNKSSGDDPQPSISGTTGGDTKTLTVSVAGRTYTLGKDASLTLDGQNWSLKPAAPLKVGIYDVVVDAADLYGNTSRDATVAEVEIVAPPIKAPTVDTATVTVARPKITGTWEEGVAASLKVTVAGTTYTLGTDESLTSEKGKWTLAVPAPLKDGTYDVAVESTGKAGKSATDTTSNELVVDAMGPASPAVRPYSGDASPLSISGTWAEGDAASLSVTLSGKSHELGKDPALSSDGKGNWTLRVGETLPPNSYDVVAVNTDKQGRASSDQTRFEILVKAGEAAREVPAPAPLDCGQELAKLMILSPLTFDKDKSKVRPQDEGTVGKVAAVMNGCPDVKFEIAGHTDSKASVPYNQALSERRAVSVRRALVVAGVDAARMSAVGYGETRPLASNETEAGRAVNRRIEITVMK